MSQPAELSCARNVGGLRCRLLFLRRWRSLGLGFYLNQDPLYRLVGQVLGIVDRGLIPCWLVGFNFALFGFSTREIEAYLPIGQRDEDEVGVGVHDRLLVRAVVEMKHAHLCVLELHLVVFWIDFDWILSSRW